MLFYKSNSTYLMFHHTNAKYFLFCLFFQSLGEVPSQQASTDQVVFDIIVCLFLHSLSEKMTKL